MPRWNSFSMLKWRERRELFRAPEKCGRVSRDASASHIAHRSFEPAKPFFTTLCLGWPAVLALDGSTIWEAARNFGIRWNKVTPCHHSLQKRGFREFRNSRCTSAITLSTTGFGNTRGFSLALPTGGRVRARMLKNSQEEAFFQAYRSRSSLREIEAVKGWLVGILRHCYSQMYRKG